MREDRPAWFLRFYMQALKAYPREYRTTYAEQAFLTARDWLAESGRNGTRMDFYADIWRDLLISLAREHAIQMGRTIMKRPIAFHTAALLCVLTALGFGSAVFCQQLLRRGADEPQRQMVETYAARIASGAALEEAIPNSRLDLSQSLEPFLAFYDEQGRPIRSNGYLNTKTPVPPAGFFDSVRLHGSHAVT